MPETLQTRCCIAGAGPAGLMLAYLLARAGIDVLILEKHADFLRDFRGDTVHPSTLEAMSELGILEALLTRPHHKLERVRARIGRDEIVLGNMAYLRTRCRFTAIMPQWDFLNFLAEHGSRYPTFQLRMRTEVTGLVEEKGRIRGVCGKAPAGPVEVRADLVVGADGRNSRVRDCSELTIDHVGASIDSLQFRLARRAGDPEVLVRSDRGRAMVTFNRGDYWHCGFAIPKGAAQTMQAGGIEALRASIIEIAPFFGDRVAELRDWDDVRVLSVRADRLRTWCRPGLLCIGDAAHAMSPIGGVGVNLAIQDAVAAANVLAEPLRDGRLTIGHLAQIQRRRSLPTRLTQMLQSQMEKQLWRDIGKPAASRLPAPVRLLERTTFPCRMRTRFIAVGFRPEHVKTRDIYQ